MVKEAKYHELIYPLNLFGVFQFENLIKIHEQCKCRLLVCVCLGGAIGARVGMKMRQH